MRLNKNKGILIGITLASLALTGCGHGKSKNPKIDGVIGPNVSFVDTKFMMTTIFKNVQLDGGLRMNIPNMSRSYIEIGPDFQSQGLLIAIGLDIRDLNDLIGGGVSVLDPTTLPGGRPLPGVAEGTMPGFAVQVPQLMNAAFYVRSDVFGVFLPVKLGLQGAVLSSRFYDDNGNPIGNISLVGSDQDGKNSGFLLLIHVKNQVAQIMNQFK